jgi:lipopolysaccharide export system permease protein
MKVLTRYLIRAHVGPLLFAFAALTGVILINTLAKELANLAGKGLPLDVVLEFFLLSLPANIALTLPMAVLVAVLYTFSTLASENEVTALRASGVDLRRAVTPLILLAAIFAGGMVWFNDQVLPSSNYRWRILMTDVAQARPLLLLRPQTLNPIPGADGTTPYYMEANEIDPGTGSMRLISIYDVSNPQVIRTIKADSGRMAFNDANTDLLVTLFDGSMWEVDFGSPESFQLADFEHQVMRMVGVSDRLQRTVDSGYRTDRDMTTAMMRARIDTLRAEIAQIMDPTRPGALGGLGGVAPSSGAIGVDPAIVGQPDPSASAQEMPVGALGTGALPGEIPLAMASVEQVGETEMGGEQGRPMGEPYFEDTLTPEEIARRNGLDAEAMNQASTSINAESERYAAARTRNIEYQIRELQVEIQKKYSIAAATLVFVLIGIPIALRFPQGGIGMVIAVSLGIFGIYYVGLIGGESLGDKGFVPPIVAMWMTNAIFGVLGLIGFLKLGTEMGTTRGGGEWAITRWLRSRRAPDPARRSVVAPEGEAAR